MKELFILTSRELPSLCPDDQGMVAHFSKMGIDAKPVIWDEVKNVEDKKFLIRTPWDYHQDIERFLALCDKIGKNCVNSHEVIRWNYNKVYLKDLEERGISIVPTKVIEEFSIEKLGEYRELLLSGAVLKPTVSASGHNTFQIKESDLESIGFTKSLEHLNGRQMMLQPFMTGITEEGEYSFMYFGGQFSHAILKKPSKGEFKVQKDYGGHENSYAPTEKEILVGESILKACPFDLHYARVDLVRENGDLKLMELEAIEPELFFKYSENGLDNFCRTIKNVLNS